MWTIEVGTPRSTDFEAQLEALLATLEEFPEGVRAVSERFGAQINCYAWRESVNPGFHLTASQIRRAGNLGLSFDFDIYAMEPDEPPN